MDENTRHPNQLNWNELIQNLTYQELHDIRAGITMRMAEMRTTGITQLRATIAEQATLLGVSLEDLVPKKKRKQRKHKADDLDSQSP
jgi:hypothetical protein